jgi:ABC-type lipoprotein export system ATPase subunit
VALARALANDPPLILADEPTASLDADAAAALIGTLDRLRRHEGRTLVIVTHRPDEVPPGLRSLQLTRPEGEVDARRGGAA